jgi:hypothetical protein
MREAASGFVIWAAGIALDAAYI